MPEKPDLLTAEQVAQLLGLASAAGARRALSRMGVTASRYEQRPESGRTQALYSAADVLAAQAQRPGSGARTDLRQA